MVSSNVNCCRIFFHHQVCVLSKWSLIYWELWSLRKAVIWAGVGEGQKLLVFVVWETNPLELIDRELRLKDWSWDQSGEWTVWLIFYFGELEVDSLSKLFKGASLVVVNSLLVHDNQELQYWQKYEEGRVNREWISRLSWLISCKVA